MSLLQQKIAQLRANRGKSSLFPDSPGGFGGVNPLAPRCGRVFAYVPSASHVCGGAVKGGKICLRLKSDDDPVCKGHETGPVQVRDGTLYVRAAKGPALTSVYDAYTLPATRLSQDLLDFLVNATVDDLTGIGPTGTFAFVQEHGCLNLGDLREAQEASTTGAKMPTMTPAKRRKDLESPTGTFSNLTDAVNLLKDEVAAVLNHVEALGVGSSVGSRAQEAKDAGGDDEEGDSNPLQVAVEDLQTRVDLLTALSVMTGETLSTVAETVIENRLEDDAMQVRNVNRLLAVEAALGTRDWSDSEVPANVWQAISDLHDEMSRKATESDLEDILELIQEGPNLQPSQGATSVQFQTPMRANPESAYMDDANASRSGRGSDPLRNQDSNTTAGGASLDSTRFEEEIKALRKLMNELRDKVYGEGGSGYTFEGKPVRSQLDIEALLEKELPSKYVPVSCFVCPYILLDFVYRYLFDEFSLSVSDRTKCDDRGLELFDFWAGEAKQKIVPSLLSTTKTIQGVNYKHSPSLKFKLPFLPSYEDFGDDTKPESIYYRLLAALESAEKALENNINLMLGNCKVDLVLLCKRMLSRSVKFVSAMFKYMDTAYKQLHASFGDKAKTWELVSFCVLEIFITEFKAGQQLAIGFSSTKLSATGSKYVFSSLSLMSKVDEFLQIGILNHPAQTASTVRFLMQMSHNNDVKVLEKKVTDLETRNASLKRENDALARRVKDLEGKNSHLQSSVDKIMTEAKKKGWFK